MDKQQKSLALKIAGGSIILLCAVLAFVGTTSMVIFIAYAVGALVGFGIFKAGEQLDE